MRILLSVLGALALSHNVYAAVVNFEEATNKALAAGQPAEVVPALEKEIYRGNLIAAQQLGRMYRDGKGVPQDYAKARKFLKVAAEPHRIRLAYRWGLADAQYELALLLREGAGGKADASAAVSWFEAAAEQGKVQAQLALAQMYINGTGIRRDAERAFIWSSIAATRVTDSAQKQAEEIREAAQKQLGAAQLDRARKLIERWTPKTE